TPQENKQAKLVDILKEDPATQAIVFTKTKLTASRLARQLVRSGIQADAIHGDKSQLERIHALDAFKQGKVTTLVATDVAARGLDIDQLPMVINYEIPSAPEDYVHRIGRTGRAGASGQAISLVSPDEEKYLKEIEKLIKREIPRESVGIVRSQPSSSNVAQASRTKAQARSKGDDWFNKPYEPAKDAPLPRG